MIRKRFPTKKKSFYRRKFQQHFVTKIAHSYQVTTRKSFEELFSEAKVGYYEALQTYDESYNVPFSSYCWKVMSNRLNLYLWQEQLNKPLEEDFDPSYIDSKQYVRPDTYYELIQGFTQEASEIVEIIFDDPHKFLEYPPKLARGVLYRALRRKGWKWKQIWEVFREIKNALQENQ